VDAQGRVYVTDRDNQRIVIFDAQNRFVTEWAKTGGNSSIIITPEQQVWTGTVLRDLTGRPIEKLPAAVNPHGAVAGPNGDLYLALLNGRVEKYVRQ
jgi:DNA-binding beta-propeller fold protein YncE